MSQTISQTRLSQLDPSEAWGPWSPSADDPWSLKWAGHLHRRAAFGASWPELQEALRIGHEAAIDGLLSGGPGQTTFDGIMDELGPESSRGFAFVGGNPNGNNDGGLQDWWLYRIVHSPHPLRERMTLFWHDHFATSLAKVKQPALMKEQNLLLRRHALGSFRPLLLEMSRDPAMLIWLDSNSNVRGKPNENYARELFELFSLGVGHYNESDIRDAARAFTGWHTSRSNTTSTFTFDPSQHDNGPKTVLGQTGAWDGADIVRIVLDQPAAARFLVGKLYRAFISEVAIEPPPDSLIEPLAEQFRASDYDIAALLRTMLRSNLFFSSHAYRRRIKGPVEYVVGMLRALEGDGRGRDLDLGADSGPLPGLSRLMDGLGQTLFAPPNVKGWPGGESWLNTATLLARHNLAWKVAQGPQGPLRVGVSPAALIRNEAPSGAGADPVGFLLDLLLQPDRDELDARVRARLSQFLAEGANRDHDRDRRLRETIHAIMLIPEYQLA